MSKIRVLVILEATLGGIRKHVVDLLLGLSFFQEFEITLAYSLDRADEKFFDDLLELKKKNIKLIKVSMTRHFSMSRDIISFYNISKIVHSYKPHIIHMHGAKAGALGRLTFFVPGKRVYIYTPHGGSFHKLHSLRGFMYFSIEKLLSFLTHNYIAVSKYSFEQINSDLKINKAKITLINNGINLNYYNTSNMSDSNTKLNLLVQDYNLVVLYPALFFEAKGHLQFIRSIKESTEQLDKKTLILLAGFGPLENKIHLAITTLNLGNNLRIIGFQKNVQEYYKICDVVILPSIAEVFGYVILEAMANYKPVIATKVGAIPELIINGVNGELIAQNELTKFVTILNYYSKNKKELISMGNNGRKFVESHYSLSDMINSTKVNYDKLLKKFKIIPKLEEL